MRYHAEEQIKNIPNKTCEVFACAAPQLAPPSSFATAEDPVITDFEAHCRFDVIARDGFPVSTSPLSIASTPSRRRASANFLSPLTCFCTRSLKLFVLAISRLRSPNGGW